MGFAIAAIAGAATTAAVTGMVIAGITIGALGAAIIGGLVATALVHRPSVGNFNATAANILTNKKSNNAPINVIYGARRVGGTIVYMNTRTNKLYLNLVVSEGEIEEYIIFYYNNDIAGIKGEIYSIDEFFGTDDQEVSTAIYEVFLDYSTEHRLRGTAYVTVILDFDNEVFPSGVPVINTLVKGVKIFDPRTQTTQWTDNPVLCVRDYLTNARYGRGIAPLLIDDASFILAANYCDELVAYKGTDFIKRYTCNGVAETQNSSLDIIKQLLSSCRGMLIFSGGLYKIIIDKPEMAAFTFSEDNIIGGWKIGLGNKNSRFNRMRANFFNAGKEFQADIAIVDDAELREQDGGLLEIMVDLPFTTNIVRAKAIVMLNLNQSRHSITCEFTSTIEGLRVEVGDVVYINHATPGWVDKKFRIMRVTLQNNDEVRILASEYADEVYVLDVIETLEDGESIEIDDLLICPPPTYLDVLVVERGWFWMSWDYSVNDSEFLDFFLVSYKRRSETTWTTQLNIGKNRHYSYRINYIVGNPTIYYDFRVRAVNTIGVLSEWLE